MLTEVNVYANGDMMVIGGRLSDLANSSLHLFVITSIQWLIFPLLNSPQARENLPDF